MEEKNGKVTLTTAILFFLLIIIIVGVALIYVGLTEKHNAEKVELQNNLQNKVEQLEDNKEGTAEILWKNENSEDKILEIDTSRRANTLESLNNDVDKVLNEYSKYPNYLRISSIKENSKEYFVGEENLWVELEYHVMNFLTEKEYQNLVKNKKILIDGREYIFKNDNNNNLNLNYGYIMPKESNLEDIGYSIQKTEYGYYFVFEVGGASVNIDYIDKVIPVKMSKSTKISIATADDGEYTLETYPYELTDEYLKNSKVTLEKINNEVFVLIDVR